jgi:hypothetical protein
MTRARMRLLIGFAVGVLVWLALMWIALITWEPFVEATGDTLDECDRGQCGALGEFTEAHPGLLFLGLAVVAAVPAAMFAWLLNRVFRPSSHHRPLAKRRVPWRTNRPS